MRLRFIPKYYISGALAVLPALIQAQQVELLGIFPTGSTAQIKALIECNGHEIRQVETTAFRLHDGSSVSTTSHEIIEGKYITATVPLPPDSETVYRMSVTLADGTEKGLKLLTPCVNRNGEDGFMWLGDYAWSSSQSGWGGHPAQVDKGVETSLPVRLNDTVYHKLISSHADGNVRYEFDGTFDRFVARYGVQDDRSAGDVRFLFSLDGEQKENRDMYAKTNTNRGGRPCVSDVELDMRGVRELFIQFQRIDDNAGDHSHVVLPRLYLQKNENAQKEKQEIRFITSGGTVAGEIQNIPLQATASSGGSIYYRILEGDALGAIRNGNELHILHGEAGEIIVEATQYGDETYACATALLHFQVDRRIRIEQLTTHANGKSEMEDYLYIDTRNRAIKRLSACRYSDILTLTPENEEDITELLSDKSGATPEVIRIKRENGAVTRYFLTYADDETKIPVTPYYEDGNPCVFVTDLNTYRAGTGYGSVAVDKGFGGHAVINLTGQTYKKGFGIHANGWVELTIPAATYGSFRTDIGKQHGQPYLIEGVLWIDGKEIERTGAIPSSRKGSWEQALSDTTTMIRMELLTTIDGNANDHGAIGAPRLYLRQEQRKEQSLNWKAEEGIAYSKPFKMPLQATASSGLAPYYTVVEGSQYASVEEDRENGARRSVLNIHTIPENDSIVVEAFQPGNLIWSPSQTRKCVFRITKSRVVAKDESIELEAGENLEELTIYADPESAGQVRIKSGIVHVKKLILRYTFVPDLWSFISFPSELNIEQISNLRELGYSLNSSAGRGGYYLCSYSTQIGSEKPSEYPWIFENTPVVRARQGYLMNVDGGLGHEPVEVIFNIDNVALDFDSAIRLLNLTLDMTQTEPYTTQDIYISPENVAGNTLKVAVAFDPEDPDVLPVNHEKALEEARITFTPNRAGIRLTLPDATPAKIAIYDREMSKLIKAIRYVSPMMIDISELQTGTYKMIVSYGNAVGTKTFEK